MSAERPWARHYQDEWHSRAGDRRLPMWLRVAALAYGSHAYNGHAKFKRGEIGLILADVDPDTGEIHPYVNVGRAINDAVAYGWLDPDSFWGCLVVPAHAIKKGTHGKRSDCPVHLKRRARPTTNHSLSDGFTRPPLQPASGSAPRTAHSVSGSQRGALSLVLSPNPTTTSREAM